MPSRQDYREVENEFLLQLGKTLAKWQWVEQACYDLYYQMMRGANPRLVSVNWHHIQSFDARLGLLDACAFFSLPDQFKAEWKTLFKTLKEACRVRNQIVHGAFGTVHKGKEVWAQIGQSHMDAMALVRNRVHNNELRPEFIIDLDKLAGHEREFHRLSQKVTTLRAHTFHNHGAEDGDK